MTWEGEIGQVPGSACEKATGSDYALEYDALTRGSNYKKERCVCPVILKFN